LEKINRDYEETVNDYNSSPQALRDINEAMFKDFFSTKDFINSLSPLNVGKLDEYGSNSDYQTFLSASPETQKVNLDLFKGNFDLVLKETKESLENIIDCLEKTAK
jgi:hypothetical protein